MRVTALYAAPLALLFLVLSVRVIQRRRSGQVALGDGGDHLLLRCMRVQANFAEYVPIALILTDRHRPLDTLSSVDEGDRA
jgi:uncharacterized membrane protein YecN with MAPEG domain